MNEETAQTDTENPEEAEEVVVHTTTETEETEGNSEETGESEDEPSDKPPEKPEDAKDGVQKRIDKAIKKQRTAERNAEYWRLKAEGTEKPEKAEPVVPGKSLADFDYDEGKFTEYLTATVTEAARAAIDGEARQDSQAQIVANFNVRESEFEDSAEDYQKVIREDLKWLSQETLDVARRSDKGPEVLYYLGKNPDVASALYQMNPIDMAREVGRIEATKLVAPKASDTNAPAPTPKIKSGQSPTSIKADDAASDKLSDDEWLKRRNKQVFSNR